MSRFNNTEVVKPKRVFTYKLSIYRDGVGSILKVSHSMELLERVKNLSQQVTGLPDEAYKIERA